MALPTATRAWTISPNNRIVFSSTVQVMGEYLFGVKEFLKTNGYTVVGSSNGTTGGTAGTPDGIDRWVVATDAGSRGSSAAAAQSWMILRAANGVDILIAYQGAGGHIGRISFSTGGLFVVPASTNRQPTATDEQIVVAGNLISPTSSGDHIWNGWVDSTSKSCRFVVARLGVFLYQPWGVEEMIPKVIYPAVFNPPVWGFTQSNTSFGAPNSHGYAAVKVASVGFSIPVKFMQEAFSNTDYLMHGIDLPAQGLAGYPLTPLSCGSTLTGASGKLGKLVDWWYGRHTASSGDTYGSLEFICVPIFGTTGGGVWPWDGATAPVLT